MGNSNKNKESKNLIDLAIELQFLAQSGLIYSKDNGNWEVIFD